MTKNKITPLIFGLMLSGCTMIPDYMRPEFSASKSWNDIPGYELPAGEKTASLVEWRAFFESPELQRVIEIALENNKDLKKAALRIDEARALYRIERADLIPAINANGDATISQSSDKSSPTGRGVKNETYAANVGVAAYELDLFGKIRSNNESAMNAYLATEQARDVVRNALIAETTNAYIRYLTDQKLLKLTDQTLKAQQQTYNIISESVKGGLSTEQDLAQATTAVEVARVNMHQYTRLVSQDQNALFLLMGVPQDNASLPKTTLDDIKIKDNLDPSIPSQVLLDRPDVKQAEYELLARNADIGAARAAFFPSISLTGTYGLASQNLSDLFTSGAAGAWAFLPQITLPIFQGGRNTANLDLAEIRKDIAIVNYEQAIQVAFREVADELDARATLDQQLKAQRRLVNAAHKVYNMSQSRYKSGVDSFLGVLDSQRSLYSYQQTEIETEYQRLVNLITLYKVLGGGQKP